MIRRAKHETPERPLIRRLLGHVTPVVDATAGLDDCVALEAHGRSIHFAARGRHGQSDAGTLDRAGLAFVMPVPAGLVLFGLDNIRDDLENPLDRTGADDVAINAGKFVERLAP